MDHWLVSEDRHTTGGTFTAEKQMKDLNMGGRLALCGSTHGEEYFSDHMAQM